MRRNILNPIQIDGFSHPGLWWDKYLPGQTLNPNQVSEIKNEHVRGLENSRVPPGYGESFKLWKNSVETDYRVATGIAKTLGRTIVGIGEKGVLEVGLRLDFTWGVPVLPGSALKGVAAKAAHLLLEDERWRKGEEFHRFLFGTTDWGGAVEFLDARMIPKGNDLGVHQDIMTVHHPNYYQTKGNPPPPSDTDSPIPIPFISVSGEFLVAVCAREGLESLSLDDRGKWLDTALEILALGLENLGIGAKTNAGYGRMTLAFDPWEERKRSIEDARMTPAEKWARENKGLLQKSPENQAGWLMKEGRKIPEIFAGDPKAWKQSIRSLFPDALELIKKRCEGGLEKEVEELKSAISDLEAQLSELNQKPPSKKMEKKRKQWQKKKDKITKAKEEMERRIRNIESAGSEYVKFMEWILELPSP